jgi:hypothetical protein
VSEREHDGRIVIQRERERKRRRRRRTLEYQRMMCQGFLGKQR